MNQLLTHSPGIGFTSQFITIHNLSSSVNTKMQFFSESFKLDYSGTQLIDITCYFLIIFTVNPKGP